MLAIQTEVSDGTLAIINVGIQYLERADISVFLSTAPSTPLVDGVNYQWTSDTTIAFITPNPVPNGVEVTLRRHTNAEEMLNIYDGGGPFNRETLDENFNQVLFLAQEFTEGLGLGDLQEDLNMNGFMINNLGAGVAAGDAVNKGQLDGAIDNTIRTPENIPALPAAASRLGKVLGFNAITGEPEAVLPTDVTAFAADLLNNTDPTKGSNLVGQDVDPVAGSEAFNGTLRAYINLDNARRIRERATVFDWLDTAEQADALSGAPAGTYTTQMQAAFAAVDSGVATDLVINRGAIFPITDTMTVSNRDGFKIHGNGLIRQTVANKRILLLDDCESWELDGLRLRGLGTDFTPLVDTGIGDGVYALNCNDWVAKNIKMVNFGSCGLRVRNGTEMKIVDLTVRGTNGLTAAIADGDLYQFGILMQADWDLGNGPSRFEIIRPQLEETAIGIRVEPMSRHYRIEGGLVQKIRGNHGAYLNGQYIKVLGVTWLEIQKVCVKLQSFHNALGPTTDAIKFAEVIGNIMETYETAISVERTSNLAPKNENVTLADNIGKKGATAVGAGVIVQATTGLVMTGNRMTGGRYNYLLNEDVGTNDCVSGLVADNEGSDAFGPAFFLKTDDQLTVRDNRAIRPCLAVAAGPVDDTAFYMTATTTAKRLNVDGNTLFVDTSGGVNTAFKMLSAAVAFGGNNDRDGKLVDITGSNLRGSNWRTFTPTITASTGTFTDVSGTGAIWHLTDRTAVVRFNIVITTVGTASGELRVTMPAEYVAEANTSISGRESQATGRGVSGTCAAGASLFSVVGSDGTSIIASGRTISMTAIVELT